MVIFLGNHIQAAWLFPIMVLICPSFLFSHVSQFAGCHLLAAERQRLVMLEENKAMAGEGKLEEVAAADTRLVLYPANMIQIVLRTQ
jgi:hypothetical protein